MGGRSPAFNAFPLLFSLPSHLIVRSHELSSFHCLERRPLFGLLR